MSSVYESSNSVITIRRIAGIISLVVSCVVLTAILLGFVPIFAQNGNPLTVIYNGFEVLNFSNRPLYYCLFHIAFSIAYIVVLVLCILDLTKAFKTLKIWAKDEHDTKAARSALTNCIAFGNDMVLRLVLLLVASYALDSYKLGIWRTLLLAVMILGNAAANVMRNYVVKHNFRESFFSPVSTMLILFAMFLFMFNIYDVEIVMFFREFSNAFRAVFSMGEILPTQYIIHVIVTYVIVPIVHMYILVKFLFAFMDSVTYGPKYNTFEKSCKSLMISNAVCVAIIITLQMIAQGATNVLTFTMLLVGYLEIILLSIAIYLLSKNQGTEIADAPTYEDWVKENEQFNPDSIKFGEVQVGEFTFNQDSFKL